MASIYNNFFVLEGIDGTGKTTIIKELRRDKELINFRFTKEPYNGSIKKLLNALDYYDPLRLSSFLVDRKIHLLEFVLPVLREGNGVICDRYLYSTLAYQFQEVNEKSFKFLSMHNFPEPSAVFYLTFPIKRIEEILERKNGVEDEEEEEKKTVEKEEIEKMKTVFKNYETIFKLYKEKTDIEIIELNAFDTITKNVEKIKDIIKKGKYPVRTR